MITAFPIPRGEYSSPLSSILSIFLVYGWILCVKKELKVLESLMGGGYYFSQNST